MTLRALVLSPETAWLRHGAYRDRTGDLRLAKEVRYASGDDVM
jgi:hypothetical protein